MTKLTFPEPPRPGDFVALIAPSSPVTEAEAAECRQVVQAMGFRVQMSGLVTQNLYGYEAGDPKSRADEFNRAFGDRDVKAVWCLRGGNTSYKLLDLIDWDLPRANPKPFVGYSDITPLHWLLNQRSGLVTFHGAMVRSNLLGSSDGYSLESLRRAVFAAPGGELTFANPDGCPLSAVAPGRALGQLTGGNLRVLASLLGTPYEIETAGKILFLEDVDESTSRIARMLGHLKLSGKLSDLAGVLLGDFTNCPNDPESGWTTENLLDEFFGSLGVPVLRGLRVGHGEVTGALPLGAECAMDAAAGLITFRM